MTASKIEWTDRSDWNPIRGCTRVSEGCRNCYAEGIAARFSGPGQPFHGFAERTAKGPRWTGKVQLVEDRLTLPLRWKKPARIFASSTSDIFHESLPDEAIDRIFAVMALATQHTFQVLTKRPERMREYLSDPARKALMSCDATALAGKKLGPGAIITPYPLPNVWLGVSVEDQATADERIPHLLATPAARRFLSCEPLLGPVDLGRVYATKDQHGTYLHEAPILALDWVIAGGESGPNARPMHPDWARSLRDQCQAAGVPFFFKQWGEWVPVCGAVDAWDVGDDPEQSRFKHRDWENGNWGDDYYPAWHDETEDDTVFRIGKARAGRLLDGREWSEFPA